MNKLFPFLLQVLYGEDEEKKSKCPKRLKITICVLVLLFIGVTGCSFALSMFVLPSGAHDVSTEDLMTPELEKDMEKLTPEILEGQFIFT